MPYRLFEVYGVEIEYAVVEAESLAVAPAVDKVLAAMGGSPDSHPRRGQVEADNELAAHVLELKAAEPSADLPALAGDFQAMVRGANAELAKLGLRLLPGGMHPFMDPTRESRLWAHEDKEIYEGFDRIFGCRGHGWFNLQSVHLNLPFADDAEFARLHNGISLLLPLLPALAASSPYVEGKPNDWLDARLSYYVANQRRLPSILGPMVPEPVSGEEEYRRLILEPMYREIAPLDPEGVLQDEWLNSRAAIARFQRNAIEIRCLDTQECPRADLALCWFAAAALKRLLEDHPDTQRLHREVTPGLLRNLFLETARNGLEAQVPAGYPFRAWGAPDRAQWAHQLLGHILEEITLRDRSPEAKLFGPVIGHILEEGNLANRILHAARGRDYLDVYAELADCLEQGKLFAG